MKHYLSNRFFLLRTLGVVILAFMAIGAFSQVKVTRITDGSSLAGRKGIVYHLPQTRLNIEINVTRTRLIPGPLAEFAGDYLGMPTVITKEKTEYAISGARITSFPEPDPQQFYLIEKEEKSQGEIWVSFTSGDAMLAMETFQKENVPQHFTQWGMNLESTPATDHLFVKYYESSTREVVDTLIRKVSIDTLVIEEKVFKRYMVGFSDKEKAREAVDKIRQLEQDKYNLLIGYQETAYSGEALQFMYGKLEEERIEYLKLFTGVEISEELSYRFDVLPDPNKEQQEYILSGFTKESGMLPAGEDNGIVLNIMTGRLPSALTGSESIPTGIVYRVPADAVVTVEHEGEELMVQPVKVMQLGPIYALPQEFKRMELDLGTGMVRKVVME